LKPAGNHSALSGQFHLGLQGNSPYRYDMPQSLGWNYFEGWLDDTGDPSSIDRSQRRRRSGGRLKLRLRLRTWRCPGRRRQRRVL
jgi:hypothetical protein